MNSLNKHPELLSDFYLRYQRGDERVAGEWEEGGEKAEVRLGRWSAELVERWCGLTQIISLYLATLGNAGWSIFVVRGALPPVTQSTITSEGPLSILIPLLFSPTLSALSFSLHLLILS